MYDTLYWESGFLDHGHLLVSLVTVTMSVAVGVASGRFVGVVLVEASCSCAVTFRGSEYGLPLESVSVTRMCVACSTVADVRPGPLTWQV